MSVSQTDAVNQGLFASGFPYDRRQSQDNNFDRFSSILKASQGVRRCGSAALDLAYLANGWLDGYWEIKLNSWDVYAGWLLVTEAGGCVSALDNPSDGPTPNGFVATNGRIHKDLIHHLHRAAPPK